MEQILNYIKNKLTKTITRPFVIAIDGSCGSGKTTLGNYLKEQLGCALFHMDDFFLQPHQRTAERLAIPGGNVDYERFQEEVLGHLSDKDGLTYQIYDCQKGCLTEHITVPYHDIVLIEGSYSCHPYFGDCYDLRIFLDISEEEQKRRILARNGEAMFALFRDQWIPMENRYFEAFSIREKAVVFKIRAEK